jgi:hypothetical protein
MAPWSGVHAGFHVEQQDVGFHAVPIVMVDAAHDCVVSLFTYFPAVCFRMMTSRSPWPSMLIRDSETLAYPGCRDVQHAFELA